MNALTSIFLVAFLALFGLSRAAESTEMDFIDFKDKPVLVKITGMDGNSLGAKLLGQFWVVDPTSTDNLWDYDFTTRTLIHHVSGMALTKEYGKRGKQSLTLKPAKGWNSQKWVFQRDPTHRFHGRQHYIRFDKASDVSLEINDSYIDYGEAQIPVNARDFSKYQGKIVSFNETVVFANRSQYNENQLFKVTAQ